MKIPNWLWLVILNASFSDTVKYIMVIQFFFFFFKALRVSMEEQRARQEQEARRGQAASGSEAATTRPETIDESKIFNFISILMTKLLYRVI